MSVENPTRLKRLLGVIGWPISHSRSPAMHNAALAALGLDDELSYSAFAVRPEDLASAMSGARALGFVGLNVTIPHKESVLALCDPDALAREVGAANTVVFDGEHARATNTDVYGFERLLAESGADSAGEIVLLGAGGAARAVATALLPSARRLTIVSRSGRPLLLGGRSLATVRWTSEALAPLFAQAGLLVDATPRGLGVSEALDLAPLPVHATVIDLVVARETVLTRAAKARGLRAATGTAMLLHQGARALELWTGRAAPLEVMRRALDASLG